MTGATGPQATHDQLPTGAVDLINGQVDGVGADRKRQDTVKLDVVAIAQASIVKYAA